MVERRRLHGRFLIGLLLRQTFSWACLRRILYLVCFQLTSMRDLQRFHPAHAEFVICDYTIENRSHYVRDVSFQEDRSRLRTTHAPHLLTACRNLASTLLHPLCP